MAVSFIPPLLFVLVFPPPQIAFTAVFAAQAPIPTARECLGLLALCFVYAPWLQTCTSALRPTRATPLLGLALATTNVV